MEIAEKIVKLVKLKGLTQRELERRAALPENRISKWLDGQGQVTAQQAARIARVLNVDLKWLIEGVSGEIPPPAISEDEAYVLRVYRDLQISADEAVRRLGIETRFVIPEDISNAIARLKGADNPEVNHLLDYIVSKTPAEEPRPASPGITGGRRPGPRHPGKQKRSG